MVYYWSDQIPSYTTRLTFSAANTFSIETSSFSSTVLVPTNNNAYPKSVLRRFIYTTCPQTSRSVSWPGCTRCIHISGGEAERFAVPSRDTIIQQKNRETFVRLALIPELPVVPPANLHKSVTYHSIIRPIRLLPYEQPFLLLLPRHPIFSSYLFKVILSLISTTFSSCCASRNGEQIWPRGNERREQKERRGRKGVVSADETTSPVSSDTAYWKSHLFRPLSRVVTTLVVHSALFSLLFSGAHAFSVCLCLGWLCTGVERRG